MNGISKSRAAAAGFAGGLLNGLFGSGGGSLAVPILEWGGNDAKRCHALSVAIMFFLSAVSTVGNLLLGYFPLDKIKPLLPAGILGASVGAMLLRKTDNTVLHRIFGALLIFSGGRMLIQ